MADNRVKKTIVDKINENMVKTMDPESFGLSPRVTKLKRASIKTHFEFDMSLSENLTVEFFGHAESFCSDQKWHETRPGGVDNMIGASISIEISSEYNDFNRYSERDLYDRAFLKETGDFCVAEELEFNWNVCEPSLLFKGHTIKERDENSRTMPYMEWLSDKLESGTHDLSQVRVLFDDEVFDGYGKSLGLPVRFDLNSPRDRSLTERFDIDTVRRIIEADILMERMSINDKNGKFKAKLLKRLDEPHAPRIDSQILVKYTPEDMQKAREAIGMADLPPFVPISATGKHSQYADAILESVLARHNIEPQPDQSGPTP
jgi:hypothetical protein